MKKYPLLIFLLTICLFILTPTAMAQSGVEYTRYDVHIVVNEDNTMAVREYQHIRFGGEYSQGFAEIPLEFVNDIRYISVYGGTSVDMLEPYEFISGGSESYTFEFDDDFLYVDWVYEETRAGDELVFMVEYEVVGGLWVYDEMMAMEWRAIAADRGGLDVPASRVTVDLPFVASADGLDALAFGPEYMAKIEPWEGGQRVVFETKEPISDGERFQVIVDFPLGLLAYDKQDWQIQEGEVDPVIVVERIELMMTVMEDGRLQVTESQQIFVEKGVVDEGFRNIAMMFVDGVNLIGMSEGDQTFTEVEDAFCDYCFDATLTARRPEWVEFDEENEQVFFNDYYAGDADWHWRFPQLVRGESTTFMFEYELDGLFTVEDDGHLARWTAVIGQIPAPEEVELILDLPGNLGLEDVYFEGALASRSTDGTILLVPETPIRGWQDWQFSMTLPVGAINPSMPTWQPEVAVAVEQAAQFAEQQAVAEARRELVIGGVKIGGWITAVLGAIATWYLWGSRKAREALGNYRTQPSSDLSPGIVAYLADGKATSKGAMSILFHLADLGLIRINLAEQLMVERVNPARVSVGQKVKAAVGDTVVVPSHVAHLFNGLSEHLPVGTAVPFTAIQNHFQQLLPAIYTKMAQEMVQFFYGKDKPLSVLFRNRIIWFFLFFGFVALVINSLNLPFMFVFVFAMIGFQLVRMFKRPSNKHQSLTELGKAELKQWEGFKAYLVDIKKYGNLAEAQEILDRYFSYAIALGVEETLLVQVNEWGGHAPAWLGDGQLNDGSAWHNRYDRRLHRRRWYQRGSFLPRQTQPKRPLPSNQTMSKPRPSLQAVSDNLTRSLNRASDNMTELLNTAVGEGKTQKLSIIAFGRSRDVNWDEASSINTIINNVMSQGQSIRPPQPRSSSSSSSSESGRSGGSSSWGSSSSSRRSSSRSRSRRSSRSSSRRSSSRRSGGGGRRGFK